MQRDPTVRPSPPSLRASEIVHLILDRVAEPLAVDAGFKGKIHISEPYYGLCYGALDRTWHVSAYDNQEKTAKKTLAACALVCRQWAAITRPHLFQTVALRFSFYTEPRYLEDIAAWMEASPGITHHIRKLRLVMLHLKCTNVMYWHPEWADNHDLCNLGTLAAMLGRCTRLRALELLGVRIRYKLQIPAMLSSVPPLPQPLNLHHCYWFMTNHGELESLDDLTSVFSWLGEVGTLAIGFMENRSSEPEVIPSKLAMPNLKVRSLDVMRGGIYAADLLDCIINTPTVQTGYLQSLAVAAHHTAQEAVNTIMPYLKELEVSYSYYIRDDDGFDFSRLTRLEQLTVVLEPYAAQLRRFHAEILSPLVDTSLPSLPPIKLITLEFRRTRPGSLADEAEICQEPLTRIDDTLSSLSSLHKLEICSRGGTHHLTTPERKVFMTCLSSLHDSGKLSYFVINP